MIRFLFVGERPSPTALRKGWTWRDGRLAAAQLFRALLAADIDPHRHDYDNLFVRTADRVNPHAVKRIRCAAERGIVVVAMGLKVARVLSRMGTPHARIPHPAARGKIRAKHVYCRVVFQALNFYTTLKGSL